MSKIVSSRCNGVAGKGAIGFFIGYFTAVRPVDLKKVIRHLVADV